MTGLKSDVAILYAWQVQASEDRHVASFKTMAVWLFYCFFACRGGMDDGSVKKLQVNMANIRRKLGCAPGDDRYIVNELGVGYRMSEPQN